VPNSSVRRAAEVVDAWQVWAPDAADPLAASLLLNAPADPRHAPLVTVMGAAAALAPEATDELLDVLVARVGVEPRTRWRHDMSWLDTKRCLAERAPGDDTGHQFSKSEVYQRLLPTDTIDELVDELVAARTAGRVA